MSRVRVSSLAPFFARLRAVFLLFLVENAFPFLRRQSRRCGSGFADWREKEAKKAPSKVAEGAAAETVFGKFCSFQVYGVGTSAMVLRMREQIW